MWDSYTSNNLSLLTEKPSSVRHSVNSVSTVEGDLLSPSSESSLSDQEKHRYGTENQELTFGLCSPVALTSENQTHFPTTDGDSILHGDEIYHGGNINDDLDPSDALQFEIEIEPTSTQELSGDSLHSYSSDESTTASSQNNFSVGVSSSTI